MEHGHPLIGGSWGRGDASHLWEMDVEEEEQRWMAVAERGKQSRGGANFQLKANF